MVRDYADQVLEDCSLADTSWEGLVWVDNYCDLSGMEVSSATNPVALVTAGGVKLNSNSISTAFG